VPERGSAFASAQCPSPYPNNTTTATPIPHQQARLNAYPPDYHDRTRTNLRSAQQEFGRFRRLRHWVYGILWACPRRSPWFTPPPSVTPNAWRASVPSIRGTDTTNPSSKRRRPNSVKCSPPHNNTRAVDRYNRSNRVVCDRPIRDSRLRHRPLPRDVPSAASRRIRRRKRTPLQERRRRASEAVICRASNPTTLSVSQLERTPPCVCFKTYSTR